MTDIIIDKDNKFYYFDFRLETLYFRGLSPILTKARNPPMIDYCKLYVYCDTQRVLYTKLLYWNAFEILYYFNFSKGKFLPGEEGFVISNINKRTKNFVRGKDKANAKNIKLQSYLVLTEKSNEKLLFRQFETINDAQEFSNQYKVLL